MQPSIITLTTDFGDIDSYVAQMKGVILERNSAIQIVDVTHAIPPQDVVRAAIVLNELIDAFPANTIHVVVVDPGVGGERRVVGVEMAGQRFVAPDNGVLGLAAKRSQIDRIVDLDRTEFWRTPVSPTFHGRDIMASVAGYWSSGTDLAELGTPPDDRLSDCPIPQPERSDGRVVGEIVWIDSFGNLITNIDHTMIPPASGAELTIEVLGQFIHGLSQFYSQSASGSLVALVGSSQQIEISATFTSAAHQLQARSGTPVTIYWTNK